jgi:lysophospholipase L1-like esterase
MLGAAEWRQRRREEGGYILVPGLKYLRRAASPNGSGWQEGREPPVRGGGVRRVVVLGDSVTEGVGVAPNEAWPEVVRARLGAQVTEVFNFATVGWDAAQSAELLSTRVAPWRPDLVVFGSYANDLFPTRVVTASGSGDAVYVDREVPTPAALAPVRLLPWLLEHSALFRHAQAVRYLQWSARRTEPEGGPGWYVGQIARMQAWSAQEGVAVLVVAIPPHLIAGACTEDPRCPIMRGWHQALTGALATTTVPWVDALPAWAGKGPFFQANLPDPDHPNATGHRILAELVAPLIAARLPAGVEHPAAPVSTSPPESTSWPE